MSTPKILLLAEPATDQETEAFLVNDTLEDDENAEELWVRTSTPGLLDAETVNRPKPLLSLNKRAARQDYFYDWQTGRYRYQSSGKMVPESRMRGDILRVANFSRNQMRDLTLKLNNGEITLQQWYNKMRRLMKDSYRAAWIVSIGGKANYDKRQQALFGRAVKNQYHWLDKRLGFIKSGLQKLDGSLVIRAGMYGSATNLVYHNNLLVVSRNWGMTKAHRVRTARESCPTCVTESDKGYVPIELVVPLGQTECRSHDACYFEFA